MKIKSPILSTKFNSSILGLILSILSLELSLRALPYFAPLKLSTLVKEAKRIPYSNLRIFNGFKGGTRILLPKGKAPVVVIGDSFPFGTYVRARDSFPLVTQRLTHQRVVNLGIGSQSPAQYKRLVEVSYKYSPDVVIYTLFSNDFIFAPPNTEKLDTAFATKPRLIDTSLFKTQLDLKDHFSTAVKWLSNQLLSYQLFKLLKGATHQCVPVYWEENNHLMVFQTKEYWDSFYTQHEHYLDLTLNQVRQYVLEAKEYVESWGGEFVVLMIPHKEFAYEKKVPDWIRKQIVSASQLKVYEDFLLSLSTKRIKTLDTLPLFAKHIDKNEHPYFSIDGHLNEEGHGIIGQFLANELIYMQKHYAMN